LITRRASSGIAVGNVDFAEGVTVAVGISARCAVIGGAGFSSACSVDSDQ
jgi:hypothetical protein